MSNRCNTTSDVKMKNRFISKYKKNALKKSFSLNVKHACQDIESRANIIRENLEITFEKYHMASDLSFLSYNSLSKECS